MIDWSELHALADGEVVDSKAREAITESLTNDPISRAEYETAVAIKKTLQRTCAPIPDDALWQNCRARIGEIDKTRRTETYVGKYSWALCGLFLLVIVGGGIFNRSMGGRSISPGTVMASSLSPVGFGTGRIQQWLNSRFGNPPVDISEKKIFINRVSQGPVSGRQAVRIDCQDANGPLIVYIVRDTDGMDGTQKMSDRNFATGQINNVNYVTWSDNGFAFLLAGKRAVDGLENVAQGIRVSR